MCDENCCATTADGQALYDETASTQDAIQDGLSEDRERTTRWRKIRGGFLVGVGCLTSPCCTPLIVPATLALLAGTPLAAFLAQYVGWVYAVLTLVSLLTLFFGVRALWSKPSEQEEEGARSASEPASPKGGQILPVKMDS